jgi:TolB-like protein
VKWRFLGLLLAGASLLVSTGAAVAAPVRAALLPIAVHSADGGTAYLSTGLAEMISARLEQTGNVTVVLVPGEAVNTSQVAKALEAGKAAGVDYVVFGAFTQFGAGASLDVQCAAVNGPSDAQARRIFVQSGTLGEIIPKLDDLAAKLAHYMTNAGQGGPVAAGAEPPSNSGQIDELRQRVDRLERTVFTQAEKRAEAAAAGGAPKAPPAKPGAPH